MKHATLPATDSPDCPRWPALLALLASVLVLSLAPTAARAASVAPGPGYSAYWYNPERSGSGLALEVLSEELVVLYWFSYDDAGQQRWVTGVGTVEHDAAGAFIDLPQLVAPRGGHFGQPFELGIEDKPVVGAATLRFGGCDAGTFSYSAFGQSASIEVQRLTQTMGSAGCWPYNGVPGKPVQAWAGQSGAWYDPDRSGAGMSLEWLYNGLAVLTWYTFDDEGHPYWIQGVGQREDGRIVFPELYTTSGAHFGSAFDSNDVVTTAWGSLSLELDCSQGSGHYESILSAFGSGDLELIHLTRLLRPACPYVKPEFTDLYQLSWTEIPTAVDGPEGPDRITPAVVIGDGTLAGSGAIGTYLWRPQTQTWEWLEGPVVDQPMFLSPDARMLVASRADDDVDDALVWTAESGWHRLFPGIDDAFDLVTVVSADFAHVAGIRLYADDAMPTPWTWDAAHGWRALPLLESVPRLAYMLPIAMSVDAATVVGKAAIAPEDDGSSFPVPPAPGDEPAVVWQSGQAPQFLYDDTGTRLGPALGCNRDCSVIFGAGQARYNPSAPHAGETWFRSASGSVHYLGGLRHGTPAQFWGPWSMAADASLVVGPYRDIERPPAKGFFVWTSRTGAISVARLMDTPGPWDQGWTAGVHVDVSAGGNKILLVGNVEAADGSENLRAVVVTLEPVGGAQEPGPQERSE